MFRGFDPDSILQIASPTTDLSPQPNQLAVIDHRTVITSSFNWSPSAAHQNDETLLVFDSPMLAEGLQRAGSAAAPILRLDDPAEELLVLQPLKRTQRTDGY